MPLHITLYHKVINSVQEACAKSCKPHEDWNKRKKPQNNIFIDQKNWKLRVWCYFFHFFHVICKISNFNMWTAKHLAQVSCTELTLTQKKKHFTFQPSKKMENKIWWNKFVDSGFEIHVMNSFKVIIQVQCPMPLCHFMSTKMTFHS